MASIYKEIADLMVIDIFICLIILVHSINPCNHYHMVDRYEAFALFLRNRWHNTFGSHSHKHTIWQPFAK